MVLINPLSVGSYLIEIVIKDQLRKLSLDCLITEKL